MWVSNNYTTLPVRHSPPGFPGHEGPGSRQAVSYRPFVRYRIRLVDSLWPAITVRTK